MPHGARITLAALILLLGVGGAAAEPAQGTTWTDPPSHKQAADKPPAAERIVAKPAPPAATPAASQLARPAVAERKTARRTPVRQVQVRHVPVRQAARTSYAPAARRRAVAERPMRTAPAPIRMARGPQIVAIAPPPEAYARYRAYGYGPGYGYTPGYTDERLDRLSSAQAAGYLVVRRRTVQFPDGRTLRVYRPDASGEPF